MSESPTATGPPARAPPPTPEIYTPARRAPPPPTDVGVDSEIPSPPRRAPPPPMTSDITDSQENTKSDNQIASFEVDHARVIEDAVLREVSRTKEDERAVYRELSPKAPRTGAHVLESMSLPFLEQLRASQAASSASSNSIAIPEHSGSTHDVPLSSSTLLQQPETEPNHLANFPSLSIAPSQFSSSVFSSTSYPAPSPIIPVADTSLNGGASNGIYPYSHSLQSSPQYQPQPPTAHGATTSSQSHYTYPLYDTAHSLAATTTSSGSHGTSGSLSLRTLFPNGIPNHATPIELSSPTSPTMLASPKVAPTRPVSRQSRYTVRSVRSGSVDLSEIENQIRQNARYLEEQQRLAPALLQNVYKRMPNPLEVPLSAYSTSSSQASTPLSETRGYRPQMDSLDMTSSQPHFGNITSVVAEKWIQSNSYASSTSYNQSRTTLLNIALAYSSPIPTVPLLARRSSARALLLERKLIPSVKPS